MIDIVLLVSARHRHGCSAKTFIRGRLKAGRKKALRQTELQADCINDQWSLGARKFRAVASFEIVFKTQRENMR